MPKGKKNTKKSVHVVITPAELEKKFSENVKELEKVVNSCEEKINLCSNNTLETNDYIQQKLNKVKQHEKECQTQEINAFDNCSFLFSQIQLTKHLLKHEENKIKKNKEKIDFISNEIRAAKSREADIMRQYDIALKNTLIPNSSLSLMVQKGLLYEKLCKKRNELISYLETGNNLLNLPNENLRTSNICCFGHQIPFQSQERPLKCKDSILYKDTAFIAADKVKKPNFLFIVHPHQMFYENEFEFKKTTTSLMHKLSEEISTRYGYRVESVGVVNISNNEECNFSIPQPVEPVMCTSSALLKEALQFSFCNFQQNNDSSNTSIANPMWIRRTVKDGSLELHSYIGRTLKAIAYRFKASAKMVPELSGRCPTETAIVVMKGYVIPAVKKKNESDEEPDILKEKYWRFCFEETCNYNASIGKKVSFFFLHNLFQELCWLPAVDVGGTYQQMEQNIENIFSKQEDGKNADNKSETVARLEGKNATDRTNSKKNDVEFYKKCLSLRPKLPQILFLLEFRTSTNFFVNVIAGPTTPPYVIVSEAEDGEARGCIAAFLSVLSDPHPLWCSFPDLCPRTGLNAKQLATLIASRVSGTVQTDTPPWCFYPLLKLHSSEERSILPIVAPKQLVSTGYVATFEGTFFLKECGTISLNNQLEAVTSYLSRFCEFKRIINANLSKNNEQISTSQVGTRYETLNNNIYLLFTWNDQNVFPKKVLPIENPYTLIDELENHINYKMRIFKKSIIWKLTIIDSHCTVSCSRKVLVLMHYANASNEGELNTSSVEEKALEKQTEEELINDAEQKRLDLLGLVLTTISEVLGPCAVTVEPRLKENTCGDLPETLKTLTTTSNEDKEKQEKTQNSNEIVNNNNDNSRNFNKDKNEKNPDCFTCWKAHVLRPVRFLMKVKEQDGLSTLFSHQCMHLGPGEFFFLHDRKGESVVSLDNLIYGGEEGLATLRTVWPQQKTPAAAVSDALRLFSIQQVIVLFVIGDTQGDLQQEVDVEEHLSKLWTEASCSVVVSPASGKERDSRKLSFIRRKYSLTPCYAWSSQLFNSTNSSNMGSQKVLCRVAPQTLINYISSMHAEVSFIAIFIPNKLEQVAPLIVPLGASEGGRVAHIGSMHLWCAHEVAMAVSFFLSRCLLKEKAEVFQDIPAPWFKL